MVLEHGGAVSGFVAENIVVPATRSAIVMLANTDFGSLDSLGRAILGKLLPHPDVPTVTGPTAQVAAQTFLTGLQQGRVDRSTLGDDYSSSLTPELVAQARKSLRPILGLRCAGSRSAAGWKSQAFDSRWISSRGCAHVSDA